VNDTVKTILLWMVIGVILVSVFNNFGPKREADTKISYTALLNEIKDGNVASVTITDQDVTGYMANHKTFTTTYPCDKMIS